MIINELKLLLWTLKYLKILVIKEMEIIENGEDLYLGLTI
jgi:hypothetical protein